MRTIRFIPADHATTDPRPAAAKNFVPQWYKDGEITFKGPNGDDVPGMKRCVPFLDVMISGFMLPTWSDVYVSRRLDGSVSVAWEDSASCPQVQERPRETGHTIPRPAGSADNHLVWPAKWGIKLPRGYSALLTHPFNRFDLPFMTLSGLIDSDGFFPHGNMPFFIKDGFEGVIPKGTPFAQVLPVKREHWLGVYDPALMQDVHDQTHLVKANEGWYKKFAWKRKDYDMKETP